MKKSIISVIILIISLIIIGIECKAGNNFKEPKLIRCTVYCDYGVTKSGQITRDGICAMNNEMLGKVFVLYAQKEDGSIGEIIGYYECLDTGGNKDLKKGKRVDIYRKDINACNEWTKKYGDYVYIQIIDGKG